MVYHLLFQDLAYLAGGLADGLVARLLHAIDLRGEYHQLGLIELDRVLRLDERPVYALQDSLLNSFLIALESLDQELHVSLHKEYFSLLLLTQSVQLQHLNQTLTGFLNDGNLEVVGEELHAYVKVAEDVVDVASNLFLICFDDLIESAEEVVVYVQE